MSFAESEILLPGAKVNYPGQGRLSVYEPGTDIKGVVLALHGSGRGISDYENVPFYKRQAEISLGHGYAFAVLENGPDTYGTDDGLSNTVTSVSFLLNMFREDKIVLWATSAGGVCAFRYAADNPEKVSAVIGTFPVVDLKSAFSILPSCRRAWRAEDMSMEEFSALTEGKNPADFLDRLNNIPMYIAHGRLDKAVPFESNPVLLAKAGAVIYEIKDGTHGTDDMRYYDFAPHAALAGRS